MYLLRKEYFGLFVILLVILWHFPVLEKCVLWIVMLRETIEIVSCEISLEIFERLSWGRTIQAD